jgi:hypothetical protein
MNKQTRLILLVLAIWLLAASAATLWIAPPEPLTGSKARLVTLPAKELFERTEIDETLKILEKVSLWGVDGTGQALTDSQLKTEQAPLVWQIVATVVRPDDRYVLITTDRSPLPSTVREGEELPNGGKLITIQPQRVVHEDADGELYIIPLNFQKSQ